MLDPNRTIKRFLAKIPGYSKQLIDEETDFEEALQLSRSRIKNQINKINSLQQLLTKRYDDPLEFSKIEVETKKEIRDFKKEIEKEMKALKKNIFILNEIIKEEALIKSSFYAEKAIYEINEKLQNFFVEKRIWEPNMRPNDPRSPLPGIIIDIISGISLELSEILLKFLEKSEAGIKDHEFNMTEYEDLAKWLEELTSYGEFDNDDNTLVKIIGMIIKVFDGTNRKTIIEFIETSPSKSKAIQRLAGLMKNSLSLGIHIDTYISMKVAELLNDAERDFVIYKYRIDNSQTRDKIGSRITLRQGLEQAGRHEDEFNSVMNSFKKEYEQKIHRIKLAATVKIFLSEWAIEISKVMLTSFEEYLIELNSTVKLVNDEIIELGRRAEITPKWTTKKSRKLIQKFSETKTEIESEISQTSSKIILERQEIEAKMKEPVEEKRTIAEFIQDIKKNKQKLMRITTIAAVTVSISVSAMLHGYLAIQALKKYEQYQTKRQAKKAIEYQLQADIRKEIISATEPFLDQIKTVLGGDTTTNVYEIQKFLMDLFRDLEISREDKAFEIKNKTIDKFINGLLLKNMPDKYSDFNTKARIAVLVYTIAKSAYSEAKEKGELSEEGIVAFDEYITPYKAALERQKVPEEIKKPPVLEKMPPVEEEQKKKKTVKDVIDSLFKGKTVEPKEEIKKAPPPEIKIEYDKKILELFDLTFEQEIGPGSTKLYIPQMRTAKGLAPIPSNGVHLGPGFDMSNYSKQKIIQILAGIGVDKTIAEKISGCTGIKGWAAQKFITDNNLQDFEISKDQEKKLFTILAQDRLNFLNRNLMNYFGDYFGIGKKYKSPEELSDIQKKLLFDYEFNVGIGNFKRFTKAVLDRDWRTALKESKRYVGKLELRKRNNAVKALIETEIAKIPPTITPEKTDFNNLMAINNDWSRFYKEWVNYRDNNDVTEDELNSVLLKITDYFKGTGYKKGNGTDTPGKGAIDCGRFVARSLQFVGFDFNYKYTGMAPSGDLARTFCESTIQVGGSRADLNLIYDYINKNGKGFYILGLDSHATFVYFDGKKARLIHSTSRRIPGGPGVVNEPLEKSGTIILKEGKPVLKPNGQIDYSGYRYKKNLDFIEIGKIFTPKTIQKMKANQRFVTEWESRKRYL